MPAVRDKDTVFVEFLLKNGANPNIENIFGCTALSAAREEGHAGIVEILLKNGANSLQLPKNVKSQPPAVTTPAITVEVISVSSDEEPVTTPNSSGSLQQIVQGVGAVNLVEPPMDYHTVTVGLAGGTSR